MLYLSQLLGAPVDDQHKVRAGKIIDILAQAAQVGRSETAYPTALLLEGEVEHPWRVPIGNVTRDEGNWHLLVSLSDLVQQPDQPADEEISLAHAILDRQVIDVERKKTIRVNDVCFANDWRILGIDDSTFGLIRRLAPAWLLGTRQREPASLIPWADIELIGEPHQEEREPQENQAVPPPVPSRSLTGHLAELHPADIAEIVHQLTAEQGARVIERLDDDTAAAAMEEIDTQRQGQILENIEPERAADILQTMGPDEAADLLAQLPEERAQQLLRLMTPEESEDVQELLEYAPNTAGGLMTTDYIALNQTRTVQEALEIVRQNIKEHDVRIAYVYCVADETQDECALLGVVSLWDILIARPEQALQDLMETDLITTHPDTDPHEVAETIAKYNLLALPVVSEQGILEGVVTVDDALDVLLPADRRRKPKRMY